MGLEKKGEMNYNRLCDKLHVANNKINAHTQWSAASASTEVATENILTDAGFKSLSAIGKREEYVSVSAFKYNGSLVVVLYP